MGFSPVQIYTLGNPFFRCACKLLRKQSVKSTKGAAREIKEKKVTEDRITPKVESHLAITIVRVAQNVQLVPDSFFKSLKNDFFF